MRKAWLPKLPSLAILLAAIFAAGCATRIGPGNVGIKVDLAGSQRGVEDLPIRTGWVFYNPAGSKVVEYPTFVQTAKWTHDLNEGRPINEELSFNTLQGLTVYGDISLSYHLDPAKVPAFYVKFRSDDIDQFTHGFLRNVARDSMNRVAANYTVEEIMGEKKPEMEQRSREELQSEVKDIGVVIEQFGFIGSPRPPESVVAAINAAQQAKYIAQQKQNELLQSQADAAKQVAAAEGQAKSQIAIAQGEAESNRLRAASISPQIIEWQKLAVTDRWIERWNGSMPQVEAGGQIPGMLLNVNPQK
jgi:regulator of protease activity HflC (stomatin/prohibitin superfamily)